MRLQTALVKIVKPFRKISSSEKEALDLSAKRSKVFLDNHEQIKVVKVSLKKVEIFLVKD